MTAGSKCSAATQASSGTGSRSTAHEGTLRPSSGCKPNLGHSERTCGNGSTEPGSSTVRELSPTCNQLRNYQTASVRTSAAATSPSWARRSCIRCCSPSASSTTTSSAVRSNEPCDALFEPVVRVGLVVESGDFVVTGGPVHGDRFDERLVRFEADGSGPVFGGTALELSEQPAADAEASSGLRNPHALDLGRRVVVELEPSAADRVRPQGRDQEKAGRMP